MEIIHLEGTRRTCSPRTVLVEAWQKAADVAHAYSIGRFESEAATNLMNHCDDAVVDALADLVKNLYLMT